MWPTTTSVRVERWLVRCEDTARRAMRQLHEMAKRLKAWGMGRRGARATVALGSGLVATLLGATAHAQGFGGGGGAPLGLIVVMAGLALLPFLLIMTTSFVKVAVVLSLLRTAIGAQQAPPNQVITGLAIILSVYIMAPVGMDMYQAAEPAVAQYELTQQQP